VGVQLDRDEEVGAEEELREALRSGRLEDARVLAERGAADPAAPSWLVAGMLEDVGLARARVGGRHDESIAASDGDGPLVIVTIDLERCAAWCAAQRHHPADRRSRATFVAAERDAGAGRRWPPGRNEPCWCGSERKYKRCCGALAMDAVIGSSA
jgi:SEC-C motif-containing protein